MRYQEALDYIWNLVNFETKPPEQREPYKLDRMRALMARLGNPQERLHVVHVAGTKGKGSTSAMIERVLRAAGYRTGLYTSPHLHDPRERLRVDGRPISEESFIGQVQRLRQHIDEMEVTTFEALTAMAFMWFVESEVDVVVLEVGLGGRLDATNLVTPLVSVITPLALEHTAVLGNTIQEIAAEKGGIIKEGVPVVSANQPPEALAVLQQLAQQRNAPLIVASEHWQSVRSHISRDGQTFSLAKAGITYQDLRLSLLGQHQIMNATLVVATLHLLGEQGMIWKEAALREGLADVLWPARVEVLQKKPLVIADGAHTYASATSLIDTINEIMPKGWSCSYLILGFSSNKDISSLLNVFAHFADVIILTRAEHPRAADPLKLAAHPAFSTRQEPIVIPNVAEAMRLAQAQAGSNDLIVATGSLFVAAEARASMGRHNLLSKEKPWTLDQFFKLISSKITKYK